MIYLIAPRIRLAEFAANFLMLAAGSWRFIVTDQHVRGVKNEAGNLFIVVKCPRFELSEVDLEHRDYVMSWAEISHIQLLEYTIP